MVVVLYFLTPRTISVELFWVSRKVEQEWFILDRRFNVVWQRKERNDFFLRPLDPQGFASDGVPLPIRNTSPIPFCYLDPKMVNNDCLNDRVSLEFSFFLSLNFCELIVHERGIKRENGKKYIFVNDFVFRPGIIN